MVDLSALKLQIPDDTDLVGIATSWYDKDIMSILQEQDPSELAYLKQWIVDNILRHIGWSDTIEITVATVNNAIEAFEKLGIKPKGCVYAPESKGEN